ncbi:MAG: hypothetical protein AAGB51_13360 [Planctomycetota bacterium]
MRPNTLLRLGLLALAFLFSTLAQADTLRLSDGRTLEGTVQNELDGYIWFTHSVGGIDQTDVFGPNEYVELLRDGAGEPESGAEPKDEARDPIGDARPVRDAAPARAPRPRVGSNAPRAAVISLGAPDMDTIGIYVTRDKLESIIPLLEEEEIDIVVFRVNSGGGLLYSLGRISDLIHTEYKSRFRTVGWIESAISAAAMSVHCLEEIYFMPEGNYGACTGWRGNGEQIEGGALEQVLYQMEQISEKGRHDYRVMRSMQITEPLSADFDPATGEVTFRQDEDGQVLLNQEGDILTFNSRTAEEVYFSDGTAATIDELGAAMGLEEVDWVGEFDPTVPYPLSKAEREMRRWREVTARDEQKLNEYFLTFQQAMGGIRGDRTTAARYANAARQALLRIRGVVRNNPNFALLNLGITNPEDFDRWYREQEDAIREAFRPN